MIVVEEVDEWFKKLVDEAPDSAALVAAAIDLRVEGGPTLGRPLVDRIESSRLHNIAGPDRSSDPLHLRP